MTEAEWLAATDLWVLLPWVDQISERKSRLLAVACCRRIMHLIPAKESRECVEAAEQYANGLLSDDELDVAIEASIRGARAVGRNYTPAEREAMLAVERVHRCVPTGRSGMYMWVRQALALARRFPEGVPPDVVNMYEGLEAECECEQARQMELLRDIFGNPLRPVTFSPEWRTDTVLTLARQMYDSRDFSAMPILADALQDAGCGSEDILNHCRDANATHARGCWVVDLVLGKG